MAQVRKSFRHASTNVFLRPPSLSRSNSQHEVGQCHVGSVFEYHKLLMLTNPCQVFPAAGSCLRAIAKNQLGVALTFQFIKSRSSCESNTCDLQACWNQCSEKRLNRSSLGLLATSETCWLTGSRYQLYASPVTCPGTVKFFVGRPKLECFLKSMK